MFWQSVFILAACAQISSGHLEIPERYFDMPLKGKDLSGENLDGHLIKQLQLTAHSDPDSVATQMRSIGDKQTYLKTSYSLQDFIKAYHLKDLADGSDVCPSDLANIYLAAYQAYKAADESNYPGQMLDYLEHFGRVKFPACAPTEVVSLKDNMKFMHRLLRRAEKFFKLAMSFEGAAESDETGEFYKALKQFKPLESHFNVDKLAPISERTEEQVRAADRIRSKFTTMCNAIYNIADLELAFINLADFFAPEAKYFEKDPELGKLNEMNRICVEAQKDGDALLKHLEKFCEPKHDSMYPRSFADRLDR